MLGNMGFMITWQCSHNIIMEQSVKCSEMFINLWA